ncbi:MAG TPA: response regulator [Verrucomicrobiales bacterium]|nr:response regulator [Verrucomicrobiales bacterium]HIL69550.1 response regulator [Verrucomicrobiota bacterium]
MSKRLLFIATDPVDVENLNRAIGSQAGIWSIEYAVDGASALALMEKDPFVAVIANSNLRDMPGAEFLNQVLEKHPESLRFITSSSAD